MNSKLGKNRSAEILLRSVNFGKIEQYQKMDKWDDLADELNVAAKQLERGGAQLIAICANTIHKVIKDILADIRIPCVNIIESLAMEIKKNGVQKVTLLGTKYTMQEKFYRDFLSTYKIETLEPNLLCV